MDDQVNDVSKKWFLDCMVTCGLGLLAIIVYGSSLAHYVYPGESAQLLAMSIGLDSPDLPLHPIWGSLVQWFASMPMFSYATRVNLLSMVCGVISVVLLYRLVRTYIESIAKEEFTLLYVKGAAILGGVVAALTFIFAVPVWQASTRLQYQIFDVMLALITLRVLQLYALRGGFWLVLIFATLWGLGLAESVVFIALSPILFLLLMVALRKQERLHFFTIVGVGVLILSVLMVMAYWAAYLFFEKGVMDTVVVSGPFSVMVDVWKTQTRMVISWFLMPNWLIVFLLGIVPFVVCGFASIRALNNDRVWSQYVMHITLMIVWVLVVANAPFSPWMLERAYGILPVATYTLMAVVGGYLVTYWYLMVRIGHPKRNQSKEKVELVVIAGDRLGIVALPILLMVLVCSCMMNVIQNRPDSGRFADICAQSILDKLGTRTWFVTDGALDHHLMLLAKQENRELNLIRLQRDTDAYYLKHLGELIEDKKLFTESNQVQRMKMSLRLGVLPFIQDWFASDVAVAEKVAVFGVPDFWYVAGLSPVPEGLFFGGVRDIQTLKDKPLYKDARAYWEEMLPVLNVTRKRLQSGSDRQCVNLRRHLGFLANNLGVVLEDLGREDEAFATYDFVRKTIDPENVSALFNEFEMARRGVPAASAKEKEIESEMRDLMANLKNPYPLWSLSRYFGYVRSPHLFAKLGWNWALSGQTGAALAGAQRAINLVAKDDRIDTMNTMAAIYALADDKVQSRGTYMDVLKADPDNRAALMGLARLSLQDGSLTQAQEWLEKAVKVNGGGDAASVEMAVICLMNNQLDNARMALQTATDLQPKNLQAWGLLAHVLLQKNELNELETVVLPKMMRIAGTPDNYYVQITKALLFMKKSEGKNGRQFQRPARDALLFATRLRPELTNVRDMLLRMDIAMNDQASAEQHARQALRLNRRNALANYIMGSIRLQAGDLGEAEMYLRWSVESDPLPVALNDLAEVLRRIQRYDDAERFARQAVEKAPELYVAWETLASILLGAGKNFEEAEAAVNKAIQLSKVDDRIEDVRMQITLARIQLRRGDRMAARSTLALVSKRKDELSMYDREELEKVKRAASDQ